EYGDMERGLVDDAPSCECARIPRTIAARCGRDRQSTVGQTLAWCGCGGGDFWRMASRASYGRDGGGGGVGDGPRISARHGRALAGASAVYRWQYAGAFDALRAGVIADILSSLVRRMHPGMLFVHAWCKARGQDTENAHPLDARDL